MRINKKIFLKEKILEVWSHERKDFVPGGVISDKTKSRAWDVIIILEQEHLIQINGLQSICKGFGSQYQPPNWTCSWKGNQCHQCKIEVMWLDSLVATDVLITAYILAIVDSKLSFRIGVCSNPIANGGSRMIFYWGNGSGEKWRLSSL